MTNEKLPEATRAQSMIVVLAKNASRIRATVLFLQRRGIAAKYVQSLNEAVELFSKKEANMLLLSANFPHPKVEMLPVLMNQSFQIETIIFAEDSDRKTSSRLNGAKTKHVLFGPVSGPIVMMKIRQIEQQIESDDELAKDSSQRRSKLETYGTVSVSGKLEDEQKAALEALKALAAANPVPEESDVESAKTGTETGSEIYFQKGQRSEMKSATSAATPESEGAPLSTAAQGLRHALDLGLTAPAPQQKRRLLFKDDRSKAERASEEQATKRRAAERAAERELANAFAKERSERAKNETKPRGEQEKATEPALSLETPPLRGLSLTESEIVQKCLREALTLVAGLSITKDDALTMYSTATLVSLTTKKFSCSFIIAVGSAKQAAGDLFYRIEVAFFSLLRDCGFDFETRQTHSILIDNMAIVERAFDGSDYVLVANRPDLQVGVASVLVKNPVATVEPYEENMASVRVQDLPVDEPVTFNVFLHLKRNRKYLKYLKVGGILTLPQVTRLSQSHPNVLLDQDDVEAYRRHYAAHSILEKQRGEKP